VEKTGYIEIRVSGSKGNLDLTPDNYDIREIIAILENAESMLFPGDKRDRPDISYRIESIWADAEFYFYGRVTNAGGKDKANIHVFTEQLGTIRIQTPIAFLEQYTDNILYRNFGVRATGKQHSETGEIDTSSLSFIELIDYQPKYDEQYLKALREKAKKSWLGKIDPDSWLNGIRRGYDA
jgi:hypothetical protein